MGGSDMELQIQDVVKTYGGICALDHISVTLHHGIYAILGPNGAGKSTLMNILATLLVQDSGNVLLDDLAITNQKGTYLDMLGYMPQQQCLYEDFTLKDFLYYIGNLKGMKKKDIVKRTNYLIKEVRLQDVLYRKIKTFSGGMKQRAMLAATLINDPSIIILDEPTAGLDPMKRLEMQNMIASFAKDKIVLIATHVVSDVEFIAHTFLFIKNGKIILQGDRSDVLQCLEGKVKAKSITKEEYHTIKEDALISSIYFQKDDMMARVLDFDDQLSVQTLAPTISDLYYYLFRESCYAVL